MAWWVSFLAETDPYTGIDSAVFEPSPGKSEWWESVFTGIDIGTGHTRAKRLEIARMLARHHTFYWTNGTRIATGVCLRSFTAFIHETVSNKEQREPWFEKYLTCRQQQQEKNDGVVQSTSLFTAEELPRWETWAAECEVHICR